MEESYGKAQKVWICQVPEDIRKRGNSGQGIQKEWQCRDEDAGNFPFHELYSFL
jgi:hypothetical protein